MAEAMGLPAEAGPKFMGWSYDGTLMLRSVSPGLGSDGVPIQRYFAEALTAREPPALAYAIARSCEIKGRIVAADEREGGVRALLNFGHTFGHAIETASGYGTWLHGEAVAAGMVLAARLSARSGRIPASHAERLVALLGRLGLPVKAPTLPLATWLELMGRDKKNEDGRITLILLEELGRAAIVKDTPARALEELLPG